MLSHAHAIVAALVALVLGNAVSLGAGLYLDYRFKIIEKVEPYVSKVLGLLKKV